MGELLTAKELQNLLNVDRSTIYRMVSRGQLPAIRVGNQWRFPREAIEAWLARQAQPAAPAVGSRSATSESAVARLLPRTCLQQVLDTFADLLGVMLLLTDLEGHLLLEPSHPCGLYTALSAFPQVRERCLHTWTDLARTPSLQPQYMVSPFGFLCARGLVRVDSELKAMVIAGGIAPDAWPPSEAEMERLARSLGVPADVYRAHVHEVYVLSEAEKQRVLGTVQRIADIVAHIVHERQVLAQRLAQIRELADISQ